jgi:hypothetical protein
MRFNIADPRPGEKLSDIAPISVRARSWLARVNPGIPDEESIQAIGAVIMLEGLDYHYAQYMALMERLGSYMAIRSAPLSSQPIERLIPTATEAKDLNCLDHEAVAYLNRLGQFNFYVKSRGATSPVRRISELMIFRNKHTAHRSIDTPKGESRHDLDYQAMAFGFYRLTRGGSPNYQITSNGKHYEFEMQRDHPVVMQEAIDVLVDLYGRET